MTNVNVGDTILAKPMILAALKQKPKVRKGTVVYIHPEERYIIAAFELAGGKVRESFLPGDFLKTED